MTDVDGRQQVLGVGAATISELASTDLLPLWRVAKSCVLLLVSTLWSLEEQRRQTWVLAAVPLPGRLGGRWPGQGTTTCLGSIVFQREWQRALAFHSP